MKWHITDEQKELMQRTDENEFAGFLANLKFKVKKLDISNIGKDPDFEISRGNKKVIIELKSRFGDDTSGRLNTIFTEKISKLHFGYNYHFRHFYDQIPDNNKIAAKIRIIESELKTLPFGVILPYSLRLSKYDVQKSYNELMKMHPEARHIYERQLEQHYSMYGDGEVAITLTSTNINGHMNCECIFFSSRDDLINSEPAYFNSVSKKAKRQLSKYLYKNIIGLLFVNHSHYFWDEYDILRLYGDLMVSFSSNTAEKEAKLLIGRNRVIGLNKKSWLSFLGYHQPAIDKKYYLFRNGFADVPLPRGYFASPFIIVKTICHTKEKTGLIILDG